MTDARRIALEMHQAYERGDQHTARLRARELFAAEPEPELLASASALLRRTEPDAFLMLIGALGLGVMVWLVYAYVL
jgi:hypothetical protein